MCYEWEWFRWRRAAETKVKREQLMTAADRTRTDKQPESNRPDAQPDQSPKVPEQLEPV